MIIPVASMLLATAVFLGLYLWRRRIRCNPALWRADISREDTTRLLNAYLKKRGWTLMEPLPWAQLFVRARQGGIFLNLVIHGKHALSLPFMISDTSVLSLEKDLTIGIFTREVITAEVRSDAERIGIFIVGPDELGTLEEIIQQTTDRREKFSVLDSTDKTNHNPPEHQETEANVIGLAGTPADSRETPSELMHENASGSTAPSTKEAPPDYDEERDRQTVKDLRSQKKLVEAVSFLLRITQVYPNRQWASVDLLWLLIKQEDWPAAIEHSETIMAKFPNERSAYMVGSFALRRVGLLARAKKVIHVALEAFAREPWITVEEAAILEAEENFDGAFNCLALVPKADYTEAILRNAVRVSRLTGRISDARRLLTEASIGDVTSGWVEIERAQLAFAERNWDQTMRISSQIRLNHPSEPNGYLLGIRATRISGCLAASFEIHKQASELFPDKDWTIAELARLYTASGDHELAAQTWQVFRASFPNSAVGYIEGAAASQACGRHEEAEKLLQTATERHKPGASVFISYASLAEVRSDWKEADERWEQARSAYPADTVIALRHASVFFQQELGTDDHLQITVKRLEELVRQFPDFAEARRSLDRALKARRELPRSNDDSPGHLSDYYEETIGTPVRVQQTENPQALALLSRFESCGSNCEFGLLQRRFGAEPISLLRWANCSADVLVNMLANRLETFLLPENLLCETSAWGEIFTVDQSLNFRLHTFIQGSGVNLEDFKRREIRRLGMLKRMFVERLDEPDRIFVFSSRDGSADEIVAKLADAFGRYPSVKMLIVLPPQTDASGRVFRYNNRVVVGRLEGLGPISDNGRNIWRIPFDPWLRLCADALALLED